MNIKAKDNKYDWAIFAYSFLLISKLACQELLDKRESKHSKSKLNFSIPYTPSDLFISIVFNIKHGIEVFIKTLSIFAYGEYTEGHNIYTLFRDVNIKIKEVTKNLKPIKVSGNVIKQSDIDKLPHDLKKIEESVLYFYTLDFLQAKIESNYKVTDIYNDIFRYPDNKASFYVDWGVVLDSQINEDDIRNLEKKLDEIYKLFSNSGYLFSVLNLFSK